MFRRFRILLGDIVDTNNYIIKTHPLGTAKFTGWRGFSDW